MFDISKKLRWVEHPDHTSLEQLQANNCGMWFTIDGTTVNSVADMLKYTIMDKYAKSLFGISLEEIRLNKEKWYDNNPR